MARVMDHFADEYDGPIGSDPPAWGSPRVAEQSDEFQHKARIFQTLSVGTAANVDEEGISDEEMSHLDPQEAYSAVRSVVSIPKHAEEEAKENPKLADLKDRVIAAYPRLFSEVDNRNPPDHRKFGHL